MTTRERLHALIDELPEERLEDVELQLAAALPDARPPADVQAFLEALRQASGLFTAEAHPEWATDADIQNWIQEIRADRDEELDRFWAEAPSNAEDSK